MATTPLDASEVLVGTANGAGLYIAPLGTALPTDTTTALPAAWQSLGYATEDGVGQMLEVDTEDIMSWQDLSPVRTVFKSRILSYKFSMLQWNPTTLALYMGTQEPTVAPDGSFTLDLKAADKPVEHALVVDIDDSGVKYRIAMLRTILSAVDDLTLQRGTAAPLGITVKCLAVAGETGRVIAGPSMVKAPSHSAVKAS